MNKAEKKFRLYAVISVLVLLAVLLTVINAVSFTLAGEDADEITQRIADGRGVLDGGASGEPMPASGEPRQGFRFPGQPPFARFGPMGPDSPEVDTSLRYFTVAFTEDGMPIMISYQISAVTEEAAIAWARSLMRETTGWTNGTYRYRVFSDGGLTFVTVIDQGREMIAPYRILVISAVGLLLCLAISFFVLRFVGRRLFEPLEDADRKQKKFIQSANRSFRLPITIIDADLELLERAHGPDDRTRSIRRQTGKLEELVSRLEGMAIFEEEPAPKRDIPLSELLRAMLDEKAEAFAARGLTAEADVSSDIFVAADPEAMKRMIDEIIENALKYARTRASFSLRKEADRIILQTENDADLPDGEADQVFDRFTTLENAEEGASGLGLAYVKEIVKAQDGRCSARVRDGVFTLRVML